MYAGTVNNNLRYAGSQHGLYRRLGTGDVGKVAGPCLGRTAGGTDRGDDAIGCCMLPVNVHDQMHAVCGKAEADRGSKCACAASDQCAPHATPVTAAGSTMVACTLSNAAPLPDRRRKR